MVVPQRPGDVQSDQVVEGFADPKDVLELLVQLVVMGERRLFTDPLFSST